MSVKEIIAKAKENGWNIGDNYSLADRVGEITDEELICLLKLHSEMTLGKLHAQIIPEALARILAVNVKKDEITPNVMDLKDLL